MKDISDAADLITTARETLLNGLLPTLTKDQRYAGLMIANAMAIALREHGSSMGAGREETRRLRKLLADAGVATAQLVSAGAESELPLLRRALSEAIRRGQFDGPCAPALVAHLVRSAADWVAISNPKALRTQDAAA
jgi:Domain of unknown function (DUF6285)